MATINGTFANDTLASTGINDVLVGGAGKDIYQVLHTGVKITEKAGEGVDTITTTLDTLVLTTSNSANVENLTYTGTGAFNGTGNDLSNKITGGTGADILTGGKGKDTLIGGEGDDTYSVDSITDKIIEGTAVADGVDTIVSSVTYVLPANVENLTLFDGSGAKAINGTGNDLDNTITGNKLANVLDGGSAGDDTLDGGLGNDTYIVNSNTVTVVESSTLATQIDLVKASVDYTLPDNVENLTLVGFEGLTGTGNGLNNKITGSFGDDTLYGGAAGKDTLIGGSGDDTYSISSTAAADFVTITEAKDEGDDTVISSVDYVLKAANVENLTLVGTTGLKGTGNGSNNVITATIGDDTLDGGKGIDTLIGGEGNDVYIVNSVTDSFADGGTTVGNIDTIRSSVSFDLSNTVVAGLSAIENLTLTGTGGIKGTGNALSNVITGNSGANILDAGDSAVTGGDDTLDGGKGNDTYIVNRATVSVIESFENSTADKGGVDTVKSSLATYTLPTNVDNLVLTGEEDINGTGNDIANKITGNDGANILDGGGDAANTKGDTLAGGLGNDTYIVDNVKDSVIEGTASGSGTDLIQSSVTYTLPTKGVENLELTGTADINATGNDLTNTITGNAGNNILKGGKGDDALIGGGGDDTYYLDSTTSVSGNAKKLDDVTETAGGGTDLVISSFSYTLSANVENLRLVSTALIGAGNGENNDILGNSAKNTLTGLLGDDTIDGGSGDDTIYGDDTLGTATGGGADLLTGGAGKDSLIGGTGDDTLFGGAGVDTLTGGGGADVFKYTATNDGTDLITDFTPGNDRIQVLREKFTVGTTTLAASADLPTDNFKLGATPDTTNQILGYDPVSGNLWYDKTGSGSGAAVILATLPTGLTTFAAGDIEVI
jgi:Ca2+-binding RTX toxin-like protein